MRPPILTMQWLGHIVLVSLMLLAQVSVAAHDLEHQALDHTEHCQVYLTAEQASADNEVSEVEFASWSPELASVRPYPFVSSSIVSTHHSRAPPRL